MSELLTQGTKVKIKNTTDVMLDGQICTVCGIAQSFSEFHVYIIELGFPKPNSYTHIILTEHCLEFV
jgi:hypothetical protein